MSETIESLKERRSMIEKALHGTVVDFEKQFGVTVSGINIHRQNVFTVGGYQSICTGVSLLVEIE